MQSFYTQYWTEATSFESFRSTVAEKADLWASYAKRAQVHEDERTRAADLPGDRRIIVLAEDWCGDAIRSIPTMVALAEASPRTEIRVLDTDKHPEALSGRLTKGGRAIPIAIVFDAEGNEIGSWGPRPAVLQATLRAKIKAEGPPQPEAKGDFYAPIMAWYAKDKGRTVAQELLMLLERG